jgi:hypothetical protein
MAVPYYVYLKMKLPGPRGVITVSGCFKKSMECARASSQLDEALVNAEEKRQLLYRVALTQQDVPVHQSPVQQFQLANDTKKILLDESNPTKFVIIGTGLSANRKASSPASSVRIGTSSHGLQKTCQVHRGSWLSTHFMSGRMPSRSSNRSGASQKRK